MAAAGNVVAVNGELAQMASLASHGSGWLSGGGRADPPALDRSNSTFEHVGAVAFRSPGGPWGPEWQAGTVTSWLRRLRDRQVYRLWLVIPEARPVTDIGEPVDEHMLLGFANGGRWSLAATGARRPEMWRAYWGAEEEAEDGAWSVRYEGAYVDHVSPQRPELDGARAELTRALQAVRQFAERQLDMGTWSALFAQALASRGVIPHFPDMLPPSYPSEARDLAAMAAAGWVFGAMGSWNDVVLDDVAAAADYAELSRGLYNAVRLALLASVNCDLDDASALAALEPDDGPLF
jgi:hypothetical protein